MTVVLQIDMPENLILGYKEKSLGICGRNAPCGRRQVV